MQDHSLASTKIRELKVAKDLGAQRVPASGATPWAKEDLKDGQFLYQHKELQEGTKSHSVKVADLEELRRNAIDERLDPVYIIEYQGKRWFMIDENVFTEVLKGAW